MANHKHIAKSGDTFDTLAKQYFNDNSIAKMLASFNKMDPVVALADAMEVNIPMRLHVLEKTTSENGTPIAHLKVVRANINVVQKGDSGDIVEEINIRLSGFGGGVPNSAFDDVTELKVKQFQKDYMKMDSPSGKVDEDTAKAIDEFGQKITIDFSKLKCPCGKCGGFGKGRNKGIYKYYDKINEELTPTSKNESYNWFEYPGVHRSVLWGVKGAMYYYSLKTNPELSIDISSGYRCNDNMEEKKRYTCNHIGKAVDLHIFEKKDGQRFRQSGQDAINGSRSNELRQHFETKTDAVLQWKKQNHFSLEDETLAKTWVHIDCRTFDEIYLKDTFFCKSALILNGESLLNLIKKGK